MTNFNPYTNKITLCIPRVFSNIGEKQIRGVFYALKLGHIGRIDIVNKISEKGKRVNRVFIHFEQWFDTENAISALKLLNEGKDIKIIYDDPWFWKVFAYNPLRKDPLFTQKVNNPADEYIKKSDKIKEINYNSSVPILDYQNAVLPKRRKLIPKKHSLVTSENELEDGEIVE